MEGAAERSEAGLDFFFGGEAAARSLKAGISGQGLGVTSYQSLVTSHQSPDFLGILGKLPLDPLFFSCDGREAVAGAGGNFHGRQSLHPKEKDGLLFLGETGEAGDVFERGLRLAVVVKRSAFGLVFEGEFFVVFACHFLADAVHPIPSETGRDVAGKARILLRIVAGGLL